MAVDHTPDPAGEIAALAPGTVFLGVYEVVRCIKAGGMGAVYEVLHKPTQRYRALKVMLPSLVTDPEMRARFELEAKIAAGIESEHIVETMDAGIDQKTGMPFIVMELLRGEELGKLLKEQRRLSPSDVVTYLHQAALALDRTHAAGIIHRDLKPENLFLTRRDDGAPRVKILDFGVAKIVADGSVNANSTKTVGSPLYMGPEQISGELKIGPPVDRYSLGHIAFTLLVGKPYWGVERKASDGIYQFMMQLMRGAKVPASERAATFGVSLPPAFDAWFAKATSVDPSERYDNAVTQIAELGRVFEIASQAAWAPPTPVQKPRLPSFSGGPVSLAGPSSTAVTLVNESSADAIATTPVPKEPGQTSTNTPSFPADRAASVMVRSDEPSLQPVSVAKPARAWVVPASLLIFGFVGIAAAFLLWPDPNVSGATNSSELVRTSVAALPSATPSVAEVVPAVATVAPSASAPDKPSASVPTASPSASVVIAKPVATTTSKSKSTKKSVLDEY